MTAVTVCSNFEAQETSLSLFPFFAWMFAVKWWDQCHELSVLNVEFGASSFTVLFPFIMRLFSPSLGGLKAFWLYVVFQSLSHVQLFPNCNMPGFAVLHHLLEFAQTHIPWVGDAIQQFHPLSSPSPPAFNLSQHQGLFQWVGPLYQVDKVSELQLQHQSFQWIFRVDFF